MTTSVKFALVHARMSGRHGSAIERMHQFNATLAEGRSLVARNVCAVSSLLDVIFGTYYLPHRDGQTLQPARIDHPSGLPDAGNNLKILLAPLGLYRPLPRSGNPAARGVNPQAADIRNFSRG
jgi:hypothetical protein